MKEDARMALNLFYVNIHVKLPQVFTILRENPHYRYVQFTPPKPHVSLHGPENLSAI